MKKLIAIITIAGFCALSSFAGNPLKTPLAYVNADSVIVWGGDRSDFKSMVHSFVKDIPSETFVLTKDVDYKADLSFWKEKCSDLNVLGGVGHDAVSGEGILALRDILETSARLFLQTGDALYMNAIERSALNQLMLTLRPGAEKSFETYHAAKLLSEVAGMYYATDTEGVYINMYINNSAHIRTDCLDFVIDQLTGMPHSNRVKLRVGGLRKGQTPLKIRLRIPDWACTMSAASGSFEMTGVPAHLPVVYVNGREETYQMEKGYLVINRKWNTGDEVYFDFPFDVVRLCEPTTSVSTETKVALQRGPLVYGFSKSVGEYRLTLPVEAQELEEPNRFGHSILQVAVKAPSGELENLLSEPVMDGKKNIWLSIKR